MKKETEEFQVFIKPVGSKCNLNCSYCYYLGKGCDTAGLQRTMPADILEKYIINQIESAPGPEIFFSWHGGEPLLAGMDFYKTAIGLQQKHRPSSYKIFNGIQTNGTLIDEEWCRFLATNNFYVGVSIDGPEEMHNSFRHFRDGSGSFRKAVEGFRMIKDYGIMNEILCVVNKINVSEPLEVYRFLKNLGASFITFLPLVNRKDDVTASGESVPPEAFGDFLCRIFDEWASEDIGRVKIQVIEESIKPAFGQEHTLCIFKKTCGRVPVVDINGDFYSCDHFVDDQHLAGNITDNSISDLLNSDFQTKFGRAKLDTLPRYCLQCEVREFCNGECPKNRFINTPDGEPGLNYLCPGYKIFFNHIRPFADAVRAEWLNRNRQAK